MNKKSNELPILFFEWNAAYEPQSSATLPEDFEIELNKNLKAKAYFETLDSRNRYAILFRINTAKPG